jgi:hypothetical protein
MKMMLFLLMVPVFSIGQTVHIKEDKIVYEGKEKMEGISASQIFIRMQNALPDIVDNYKKEDQSSNSIKFTGQMKLKTPYSIIRSVHYSLKLEASQDGYEYSIDDISFTEQKRGEKAVTKSSKEVLENMSETGKIVSDTEQILNETDMRFQKLLDFIKSEVNKR